MVLRPPLHPTPMRSASKLWTLYSYSLSGTMLHLKLLNTGTCGGTLMNGLKGVQVTLLHTLELLPPPWHNWLYPTSGTEAVCRDQGPHQDGALQNIQNDTGKLATAVAKDRELSAKLIGDLGTHISILKNTLLSITAKTDPYVANQSVARQLVKQVHTENALQNISHPGAPVHWSTFSEWRNRMDASIRETYNTLEHDMSALPPDHEWIAFAAHEDHLVDPETPLQDPQNISYPSEEDPSIVPVHIGLLERKKQYTRTYREAYYVNV
ncbi:hypothetical protein WOLCODRAFT_155657 [Wolfiporia cocos MD-104 SS10]|uniref:Uncharacterized protein n=1 Tax=Wolfiporia cocos (strain MD-104) TaxID=742152 RepID=A0A2H3IZX9_WOLCO|nr:hypothetical protein WOLCODRAFT_155657 [Wolfiporia cocos MD-104 SS10]